MVHHEVGGDAVLAAAGADAIDVITKQQCAIRSGGFDQTVAGIPAVGCGAAAARFRQGVAVGVVGVAGAALTQDSLIGVIAVAGGDAVNGGLSTIAHRVVLILSQMIAVLRIGNGLFHQPVEIVVAVFADPSVVLDDASATSRGIQCVVVLLQHRAIAGAAGELRQAVQAVIAVARPDAVGLSDAGATAGGCVGVRRGAVLVGRGCQPVQCVIAVVDRAQAAAGWRCRH